MKPEPERPIQLPYAANPAWYHTQRARRAGLIFTLILLGGVLILWSRPLARYVQILYWEHQCLNFERPPTVVTHSLYGFQNMSLPRPWWYYSLLVTPTNIQFSIVYLHERRAQGGPRRLVSIDSLPDSTQMRLSVRSTVFSLAGFSLPHDIGSGTDQIADLSGATKQFVVYSGTTDQSDESHFTFDCDVNGVRTTFDGWLQSDDTVLIQPRREIIPPPPSSAASSH